MQGTAAFDVQDTPWLSLDEDADSRALDCLHALRQALKLPSAASLERELHFLLEPEIVVAVVCGEGGRIAMLSEIAPVSVLTLDGLVHALAETGEWGLAGHALRAVIVDDMFSVLWTTEADADESRFARRACEALARVVGVAQAVRDAAARPSRAGW